MAEDRFRILSGSVQNSLWGRSVLGKLCNKLLHNWSRWGLLQNQQQLNLFIAQASIVNLATVQLRTLG